MSRPGARPRSFIHRRTSWFRRRRRRRCGTSHAGGAARTEKKTPTTTTKVDFVSEHTQQITVSQIGRFNHAPRNLRRRSGPVRGDGRPSKVNLDLSDRFKSKCKNLFTKKKNSTTKYFGANKQIESRQLIAHPACRRF